MSIELKQAAQQAVDAFDAFGDADDFASLFELTQKMRALRAAIQQATESESVYQIRGDIFDCPHAWRDATEEAFYVTPVSDRRILYTHPAPGVPDAVARDAERYRWLRENGTLGFSGAPSWRASVSFDAVDAYAQTLDSNIDAARAQKGQP